MGCGCKGQTIERSNYDNIKKIAQSFALSEKQIVCLYKDKEGRWSFMPINCPEFKTVSPKEFVSPLQRDAT